MANQTVDLRVATFQMVGKKVDCWVVQMAARMAETKVDWREIQMALKKAARLVILMALKMAETKADWKGYQRA